MKFPSLSGLVLVVLSGCAWRAVLLPTASSRSASASAEARVTPIDPAAPAIQAMAPSNSPDSPATAAAATVPPAHTSAPEAVASVQPAADDDDGADDDAETDDEGVEEEGESIDATSAAPSNELRYTADLDDAALLEKWRTAPESLGSISLGFVHDGRLVNAERMPPAGPGWVVVCPEGSWGTRETIDYIAAAAEAVHDQFPDASPLRVNQVSLREGGYVRPHLSHQNGRDVDLGFYYPNGQQIRTRAREKVIDVPLNWALVKALVTLTDVQLILVDRRVQKVLFDYAVAAGEDKAWLDSLFHAGKDSILQHARRHRDHFHVP